MDACYLLPQLPELSGARSLLGARGPVRPIPHYNANFYCIKKSTKWIRLKLFFHYAIGHFPIH